MNYLKESISCVKADYNRYVATSGGKKNFMILFNLGLIATSIFRINRGMYYTFRKIPILGLIVAFLNYFTLKFNQIVFGISFPVSLKVGKGLFISHLGTIIINGNCEIGENCNIAPMTVIGWGKVKGIAGVPNLGNRVWVGPGAKIFGPIKIGDDVAIGANAVVNFDIPNKSTVVGNPGRIIYDKGSSEYIQY